MNLKLDDDQKPTMLEKRRRLPWSFAVNAANTAFLRLTFLGSVFVLFLSELGLGKGEMGLLLALLPFAAAISPFLAGWVRKMGYKRTYLLFFGARTLTAALLLLTPWIISQVGPQIALLFVGSVVAIFALMRAVGVTALSPWSQEFVPSQIRGRYSAVDGAIKALAGFLAVLGASFVLERSDGLWGFMLLISAGVVLGLSAVISGIRIPGGASQSEEDGDDVRTELMHAARDKNFRRYLIGLSIGIFAVKPMYAFLPLYMEEVIGLSAGRIVFLQVGTLLGGLLTSYVWGWFSDRYGSKPIMITALFFRWILPLGWIFMPQLYPWSLYAALGIAFVQGIGNLGWQTGSKRLRYVNLVPAERKDGYMALFFAWIGIVGGFSRLIGGWILEFSEQFSGTLGGFTFNPYLPLFLIGFLLPPISLFLLRRIDSKDKVSASAFLRLFTRGKPLLAMGSLVGLRRAKDEETAASMTERLGQARSPLVVEELIDALGDPRFHVRLEALIAIAHMDADPRLARALVEQLDRDDPVLRVLAAWALGRLGHPGGVEPLRAALEAPDSATRSSTARSLAFLADESAAPILLRKLEEEDNNELKIAYASALGQLQVEEAVPAILSLLKETPDRLSRRELVLAIARIVGEEHRFLEVYRQAQEDSATATAEALLALKKQIEDDPDANEICQALDGCAQTFARQDTSGGVRDVSRLLRRMPESEMDLVSRTVLQESALRLDDEGEEKLEYVLLALHTLEGRNRGQIKWSLLA